VQNTFNTLVTAKAQESAALAPTRCATWRLYENLYLQITSGSKKRKRKI